MSKNFRRDLFAGLAAALGLSPSEPSDRVRCPSPGADPDPDFVRRARRVVESGLHSRSFGVADLARALRMSPRHLQRRLNEEAGQSPSTFIRTIRLERARSLIEDGCHSVGEAAQAARFSSLSYFARCFREEYGLNPSEYGLESNFSG